MSDQPHDGTSHEEQPTSTTAYNADLDISYAEAALEKIRSAVKGNGIKTDDVKIAEFNGNTLEFIASTTLQLRPKLHEKTVAGKTTGPKKVDGPQALREEIEKEKNKLTHDQSALKRIKEILLERKDKGFGLENEIIKLPALRVEYVYYEQCNTCKSQGKIQCQRCHGQGYEQCTRCHGDGFESCHNCHGAKQIQGQGGQYQPCPRCHGHGKTSCTMCRQTKKIQCTVCKTAGHTKCVQCNGMGFASHLTTLEFEALAGFDYDRADVPEKLQLIIDDLKKSLVEHITYQPIILEKEPDSGTVILPYKISLPHAQTTFTAGELEIPALLFGHTALPVNTPSFLDELLKKPLKRLDMILNQNMDITDHIQSIIRYKTVRHGFMAAAKFKGKKAALAVLKANPLGLSQSAAMQLVENANKALVALTRKQVQTAQAVGSALGFIFFALYYFTPLRHMLIGNIPNMAADIVIDILVFFITGTLTTLAIKTYSDRAKQRAVQKLLSK